MSEDNHTLDNWKLRRRVLYSVLSFCAFVILYCLGNDMDSVVAQTAVFASFGTIASSVMAYVFGAVYDDKNKMTKP